MARAETKADGNMFILVAATLLPAVWIGCGDTGPPLIPVSGKVTLDGQPAAEGGVVFHSGPVQFLGSIKPDGTYSMFSAASREPGVPAGKYKVTVFITSTPKNAEGEPTDLPTTLSNRKFMNVASTPLEVEVVETPSAVAYDLAVTK